MMDNLFSLVDVNKKFIKNNSEVVIFKNYSFNILKGEFVCIVGKSGSGKSTLLHMMGGMEQPTSGDVLFKGKDIYSQNNKLLNKYRNREVGLVFQQHFLLNDFTALENIIIPQMLLGTSYSKAQERAESLLLDMGIIDRKGHYPMEMSGGEQQRVAIARALSNNPEVILADEPTGNLDSENALGILNILKKLNSSGVTVVMVTHDRLLADKFEKLITI